MQPLRKNTPTVGMLTLWHLSVVRQAWDVGVGGRDSGSNCWQRCQSWAEGVHTVNMAHAQRHGHKGCEHANMQSRCQNTGWCWTLMTQDNKQSLCPCSQCQGFFLFFFLRNFRTSLLHSLFGYHSFKSVLYVYVRADWSPWPSNAYFNIILKGNVSFIKTVNNQHSFFSLKRVLFLNKCLH